MVPCWSELGVTNQKPLGQFCLFSLALDWIKAAAGDQRLPLRRSDSSWEAWES